jgi:DNA-binding response OmpR family regulator
MFRALDAFFVRENNKTDSMEEAAPQPTWLPDEPAVAAGHLRVLVADSVASDRFALGAILRRIEPTIEILEAPNGAVAERLLRERNVDIGFIDRRLPGFDGREVQNWASTSDRRSMFVLVSDRLVPKWSEIATLINAYEVMLKPFNESHVENLLKVFWRLNRSADVLLVDRSRTARKIIRDMLERTRFNFRVDETDTGANALRAVKASAFDIVLVDAGVKRRHGRRGGMPGRPRRARQQGGADRRRRHADLALGAHPVRPLGLHPEAVRRRRPRERAARRAQALAPLPPQRADAGGRAGGGGRRQHRRVSRRRSLP